MSGMEKFTLLSPASDGVLSNTSVPGRMTDVRHHERIRCTEVYSGLREWIHREASRWGDAYVGVWIESTVTFWRLLISGATLRRRMHVGNFDLTTDDRGKKNFMRHGFTGTVRGGFTVAYRQAVGSRHSKMAASAAQEIGWL